MRQRSNRRLQPLNCTQIIQRVRCCGRVITEQEVNDGFLRKTQGRGQGRGRVSSPEQEDRITGQRQGRGRVSGQGQGRGKVSGEGRGRVGGQGQGRGRVSAQG